MKSFWRVCMNGTIFIHLLWQERCKQLRKVHNTYSRTPKIYRIVPRFAFLGSKAKYRFNCYLLHYDVHSSELANILSEYRQAWPLILTQRWIRRLLQKYLPHSSDIKRWEQSFLETGYMAHGGDNLWTRTSEETTQQLKELFRNDSTNSIRASPSRLHLPRTTQPCILRKCFVLFPEKLQNFQALNEVYIQNRLGSAEHCSKQPEGYSKYLSKLFDECMFRISCDVNKRNENIWGVERTDEHSTVDLNSPAVMTWCPITKAITKARVILAFFR